MKKIHFTIDTIIYPNKIYVFARNNEAEMKKTLKTLKVNTEQLNLNLNGAFARTARNKHGDVLMFFTNVPDHELHAVIAHESFHAANFILEYIGQTLTDSSEESYAYLLGYITKQIYKHGI